jgi:RNA polymerase sigma-70 factor (ECF subfamily)
MDSEAERLERCLDLFSRHQRRLYLYISALVPSPADVEEILHETNIVVWKKFDQFEPGSDFLAWAFRIAHLQILDHRRRSARARARFSDEVLEQLAGLARTEDDDLERRRHALQGCRGKLPAPEREILDACYAPGANVEDVARRLGRAPTSVYRTLRRLRQVLLESVQRALSAGTT